MVCVSLCPEPVCLAPLNSRCGIFSSSILVLSSSLQHTVHRLKLFPQVRDFMFTTFFILFIFFGTTQCLYFLQLVYFIYVTFPVLASSVLLFTCVHLDCPLGRRHVLWEKGRVLSPGRRSSSILRSAAGLVVEQGGGEGG